MENHCRCGDRWIDQVLIKIQGAMNTSGLGPIMWWEGQEGEEEGEEGGEPQLLENGDGAMEE